MRKVKLAALITALALSVTAFAACGKKDKDGGTASDNWSLLKLGDVYNTSFVEGNTYASYTEKAEKIDEIDGYSRVNIDYSVSNNAVLNLFTKADAVTGDVTYKFYNLTLGKVVLTKTVKKVADSSSGDEGNYVEITYLSSSNNGGNYAFAVKMSQTDLASGTVSSVIYGLDGSVISESKSATVSEVKFENSEVKIGNSTSDVKFAVATFTDDNDETFKKTVSVNTNSGETEIYSDKGAVNEFENFEFDYEEVGENKVSYDSNAACLKVYDKNTDALKFTFDLSVTALANNVSYLANGNALCQSLEMLDEDATDYAFFNVSSGKSVKYGLKSYILNLQDGSKTEINLGFIVGELSNALTDDDFAGEYKSTVENVGSVSRIIDKKLANNTEPVVINNDLTVAGTLRGYVPNQESLPELVADGIFKIEAYENNYVEYYVDADGKVIGKVSQNVNYVGYHSDFISTNNALYSARTLDKLIDLSDGVSIERSAFGANVVVKKSYEDNEGDSVTEYYLCKRDSSTPVLMFTVKAGEADGGFAVNDRYYNTKKVKDGVYNHVVKNSDGVTLFEYADGRVLPSEYKEIYYNYYFGYQKLDIVKNLGSDGNYSYSYYRVTTND